MPTTARVAVLPRGQTELVIEEIVLPNPVPDQVVVKLTASGICHSQLHEIHDTMGPRDEAILLGHEATGTVVATGSEVTHVKAGDPVWITWISRNESFAAVPTTRTYVPRPGGELARAYDVFTWADHTIAHHRYVVPMPAGTRMDVTSLMGCAVPTGAGAVYNTARVRSGESVAVFGAGGVGLCAVAAASILGANPVIAVDLSTEKLEFAKRFGATIGVDARASDPIAAVRALTEREGQFDENGGVVAGVDYAFDCIGVPATMAQILPSVRAGVLGASTGGTAVLVGVPSGDLAIDPFDLLFNEKKYISSYAGSSHPERDFPLFLRWYESGALDLDALVTRRYSLDQINDAVAELSAGKIAGRAIIEY